MASLETPKGQTLLQLKVWSEIQSHNCNCKRLWDLKISTVHAPLGKATEKCRVAPSLTILGHLFFEEKYSGGRTK